VKPKSYKFAGWLAQLATTSTFSQLSQYANSPGHRAYCYLELAVFFAAVAVTIASSLLISPTNGRMTRLSWPGWLR